MKQLNRLFFNMDLKMKTTGNMILIFFDLHQQQYVVHISKNYVNLIHNLYGKILD